jgi:hypothetical protein
MWEWLWRVRVVLHDRSCWYDDLTRGDVASACVVGRVEVGEPFRHLIGFRVGEEKADLALYPLWG